MLASSATDGNRLRDVNIVFRNQLRDLDSVRIRIREEGQGLD